ncbi:MAG: helix-turn-helix transcriptional regulator [Oscillospiraceae bacterium]|nr:helix-turn-helix transcriptional regulator [Oscillospiraceae bacterium]
MKKIEYGGNKNIIGRRLEKLRREKRMSQEQLAAKMQTLNVNMDQQMVSRIERNLRIVTDYEMACFCRILHVTERDMLRDFYENLENKK